ncbi:MAG: hypothetical protein JXQ73_26355 [Phycisphaerae bacterium]|nr:hypothetical protein [Phycisphaerae bacterium]
MRPRAFGLLLVLLIIPLVGGAATVTIMHLGEMTRRRATQITESTARALLDSGIAYARKHAPELAAKPSGFELSLPTDDLLQTPTKGQLTFHLLPDQRLEVLAVAEFARARARRHTTIPLSSRPPSTASSPTSRPL